MVRSLEALKKRADKRGISLKEMMMKEKKQSTVVKPKVKEAKKAGSEIILKKAVLATPATPLPHPPVDSLLASQVDANNQCIRLL
jgi:hypothetical protein